MVILGGPLQRRVAMRKNARTSSPLSTGVGYLHPPPPRIQLIVTSCELSEHEFEEELPRTKRMLRTAEESKAVATATLDQLHHQGGTMIYLIIYYHLWLT